MTTLTPIALLFTLFLSLSVTGFAQQDDSAKPPTLSVAAAPSVTMSLTTKGVRFSVPGALGQLRLEVFDHSGVSLYNSDFRPATVFDWPLQNKERQALADGTYLCVVTLRGVTGKLSVKQGTVVVQNGQAALQLDEAQVGTVEPERSLTAIADLAASPATIMVHDGQNGQVVTTGNALTFRIGNFFAGLERERMRLTADGRLGIGTSDPKATLDVAGTIRATKGIEFADGTVQTTGLSGRRGKDGNVTLLTAGTGTLNRVAKWTETGGSGTLGDAAFSEVGGLTVFGVNASGQNAPLFPTAPDFHVVEIGAPGTKTPLVLAGGSGSMEFWKDRGSIATGEPTVAIAFGMGTPGTATSNDIVFSTYASGQPWSERMRIANGGNVGIGLSVPQARLDVAGSIKLTGVGASLVFADGTSLTTASTAGGGISGSGTTGAVALWSGSTALGNSAITQTGNDVLVNGNFSATGNLAAKYQDVAEWVPARGRVPAGTVVSLDLRRNNTVMPSARAYDTHVAGVVSARPGLLLGEGAAGSVMVATTGRVKVRVDATRLPVRIGDLLVTSGKPGVAMRSLPIKVGGTRIHRPGTIIGKALEPLANGQGEILVLLSLQ